VGDEPGIGILVNLQAVTSSISEEKKKDEEIIL
jgi:hypothetical protein